MHWFYDPEFSKDKTFIAEAQKKHLKSLRIRPSEQIAITDGNGSVFICSLTDINEGRLEVNETRVQPRLQPIIHLVQALAKGDRDEQALQASVELGVSSVTPWQAEHSISIWGEKAQRNQARWQEIAVSAMKQSQQPYLTKVNSIASTQDIRLVGQGLVLDPRASHSLSSLPKLGEEITVVVGPEGGISEGEIRELEIRGFIRVRLGESVLRTSTAGPSAIAAILALSGNW